MPELAHFPADADPDRVQERLLADGAIILDAVLTRGEADAVRAELDARDRQRAAQRRSIFADTN